MDNLTLFKFSFFEDIKNSVCVQGLIHSSSWFIVGATVWESLSAKAGWLKDYQGINVLWEGPDSSGYWQLVLKEEHSMGIKTRSVSFYPHFVQHLFLNSWLNSFFYSVDF